MFEPPPSERGNKPSHHLLEDIFILLCILSLWPTILRWRSPFYEYLLYVALAGLVIIFFRRVKRFRQARNDLDA